MDLDTALKQISAALVKMRIHFDDLIHSSGKAFRYMLEHCCRDFLPFSHKSISEH
jgi:hypothetical protein